VTMHRFAHGLQPIWSWAVLNFDPSTLLDQWDSMTLWFRMHIKLQDSIEATQALIMGLLESKLGDHD
jgi:hypothetical protein